MKTALVGVAIAVVLIAGCARLTNDGEVFFGVTNEQGAYSVGFYGYSENTGAYVWDFGDGKSAYGQNVVHNYGKDGSYIVTLRVGNGEFTRTVHVEDPFVWYRDGGNNVVLFPYQDWEG